MENAYHHLVSMEGKEVAQRIVHNIYCHINLGERVKFNADDITDMMHSGLPFRYIIDELVGYTIEKYPLDEFLKNVSENEFERILLDFEEWDKINPQEIVLNLRKRMFYETR